MTNHQPIPEVNENDVERIVRRDYPAEQFDTVMNMLNEYGVEQWQRENSRVRLAAMKLAAGNLEMLRRALNSAKVDYRDVLSGAEYPTYESNSSQIEKRKAIENDWNQYQAWLNRR